jgi:hypothetical protein
MVGINVYGFNVNLIVGCGEKRRNGKGDVLGRALL